MRLAISVMLSLAAFWSNSVLAQGYSDEYNKCLNTSYGEIGTVKKCVEKELKNQFHTNLRRFRNYNYSAAMSYRSLSCLSGH